MRASVGIRGKNSALAARSMQRPRHVMSPSSLPSNGARQPRTTPSLPRPETPEALLERAIRAETLAFGKVGPAQS
jgi:hypothetical protein